MIAYLLYTQDSPMEREVQHLDSQLKQLHVTTKLVEADSLEGISLGELYDLTARPAVVVVTQDGGLIQQWQGQLPAPAEVSYLAHS